MSGEARASLKKRKRPPRGNRQKGKKEGRARLDTRDNTKQRKTEEVSEGPGLPSIASSRPGKTKKPSEKGSQDIGFRHSAFRGRGL